MERQSFIHAHPRDPECAGTYATNDIAAAFSDEIDHSFREHILPEEFGVPFLPDDAPLYVNKRQWWAADKKPGEEFGHEQYLHRHFWPPLGNDYPLLILEGGEGMGKSTLVRYYFDCYLPHFGRFPYVGRASWDEDTWKRALSRHVVLYVDLRRGPSRNRVEEQVFSAFHRQMIRAFPKTTVDDDYAMWQRIARWENPVHAEAERAFPDRSAYRADYVKRFLSGREVVEEELWYLASQRDAEGRRKYYVSLIFDNLDQQDKDIQHHVLELVLHWLGPTVCQPPAKNMSPESYIDLWKVLLPLRPETLRSLSQQLHPINRRQVIGLGEVDETLLLSTRGESVATEARASLKQVETVYVIKEDNTHVYCPLPNFVGASELKRMLTCDLSAGAMHEGERLAPGLASQDIVGKFCGGSVRRLLRLRRRLAMSVALERTLRGDVRKRWKDASISHYTFLDAWLTGDRGHYEKGDIDNDIVNLYDTTHQVASSFALLVGPHVLYLLRSRSYGKEELTKALMAVGYREAEVQDCLEAFHVARLFNYGQRNSYGDIGIDAERNIVEAHWQLLTEPAYTDNMAIVTPVEVDLHRQMQYTTSCEPGHFLARVRTAGAFLRQIRNDELVLCTWREDSPRHGMGADDFCDALESLALPSIYRKAASRYSERLEALRKQRGVLSRVMQQDAWDRVIQDDIFAVTRAEANSPLKARVAGSLARDN